MAAAALILILMLPGFIGALLAIWVVGILDRRRARKQERQLKRALSVVKTHADEIHTKLAA
jgi:Flp pilus assembly protein TadB